MHGLKIYVDTLVLEFIAATGGKDESVVGESTASKGIGHTKQLMTRLHASRSKSRARGHEIVFKTIHENGIATLVEQLLTLTGSDIADRGEAIDIVRRLPFNRVFSLHVQFGCHLIAVVGIKIVVQRLVVASYTSTNAGGMGGEDGGNGGNMLLHIECAKTCHPLMGLKDYAFLTAP